jgi:arylsulfate sulfotransferase
MWDVLMKFFAVGDSSAGLCPSNRVIFTFAVALTIGLWAGPLGCDDDADPEQGVADAGDTFDEDTEPVQHGELEVEAAENPSNALSYYIQWTTEEPSLTTLELDCGDGEYEVSYEGTQARTDHEVFVMGLWDGARCTASATAAYDGGGRDEGSITFSVGPIADFLPELDANLVEPGMVQEGWTLFNLNNVFDDTPLSVAMVDAQGRYRWYHQLATSDTGADSDVRTIEEGVLVGGNRKRSYPTILDWEGNVVWEREYYAHHAIRPYGDDQLIFLGTTHDCPSEHGANTIVKYDFSEDDIVWEWSICQHFEPDNPTPDWSHINSLELLDDDQSVILSSRTQHSLFKVDLQTEEIEWMMGQLGEFELSDDDQFYRQHSPEVQENGNILLFDNGNSEDRPYSRAIEIEYDAQAKTAEVVWAYRPDPDIFTPIWGDADRMDNGNTLITFGERKLDKNSHLIEVNPDKQTVWELIAPPKWGWYRSERVVSPPTGHVVN